ncbi:protein TORNADO 1 [Canna indica]|uniref:Protein TORNADO 1 n=1 Tax=Canna indica TaxID=4628 RepID=A0AAQ3KUN6_9LILI|nr:protein TORNADO 1 [Canna indica]
MSSSASNLHEVLHSIRSANITLQNISFHQSQSSSSSSQFTENSMSIYISANEEGAQFFCQILDEMVVQRANFKNIINLAFHQIYWEQRQLQKLCSFIGNNLTIEHLELERNMIGIEGMRNLSLLLERNEGIKAVTFSECRIESIGARLLSSALQKNDTLEELQIWEDSIASRGAEDLARMIEVNPTLKLLIVFDKESITATPLISAILARSRNMEVHIWSRDNSERNSKVVEFTPESNTLRVYKLNVSGSQRVACALAWNTTVRTLDLTGIRLKSKWAREFRVVLEKNQSLKDVKLSRTCIRDKSVVYIAAGLFMNQSLENLHLDQNRFTGVGVEHLLCPLSRFSPLQKQANTTLKSLVFGGSKTKIGRDGLLAILRMLETNKTITKLSILGDTSLKPDDIIKIFRVLERNATLRCLSFEGCMGVQGDLVLQTIMETLQVNPWIEEIDLARTPLQIAGKTDGIYEKLGQNGSVLLEEDLVDDLPMALPGCCRIFFCGQEYAGKSTLCSSIFHNMNSSKLPYMDQMRTLVSPVEHIMRRPDVKIKTVHNGDIKISIWNLAAQHENFALHDLIFPGYGSPSSFLIVSSLFQKPANKELKTPEDIEDDLLYWLKFIVSNSRRATSQSILPYVTIVLTHSDRVQSDVLQPTANSIQRLKERFQGYVDLYPTVFMVDARSSISVSKLAHHLRKTSETILQRVPQVFELCNEFSKIFSDWRSENLNKPAMRWKEFGDLCQIKVPALRIRSRNNNVDRVERRRRAVVNSLHHIGEVIFFEDLEFLILDCEWFFSEVVSQLVRLEASNMGGGEKNGFISRKDLEKILNRTMQNQNPRMGSKLYDNLEAGDLIKMMLKLELCYEQDPGDPETLLLIPSILEEGKGKIPKWQASTTECIYVGRQLECDHWHMFLTKGFFPRLQVHLYNRILQSKNQQGAIYSLEKNLICIFINGIQIQVETGGQLSSSIDILACSTKNISETLRLFHQLIIPAIQSTLTNITFTEKVIRPDCISHLIPPKLRKTQCVPLQQIKQALLSMPADSMYDYQHTWSSLVNNNKLILPSGSDFARDLLSDEDFREVLHRRYYDLHHLASELAVPMINDSPSSSKADASESQYSIEPSLSGIAKGVEVVLQRLKILEQEIRDLKLEIQGLRYYEHQLLIELHRKVDYLVNFNIELEERKLPRLFYFVQVQNNARRLITTLLPGMTSLRLHMLCEYRQEMHVVDDQVGCELTQVDNETIKRLLPYMTGLIKLLTFALKIGAHVVAGMGQMIPDLAREFAHLIDSSLVYGAAAMAAGVVGYAASGQGGRRYRSRSSGQERNVAQEVVGAQQWLVDFLKSQRISTGKDIVERFGLWRVRYRDSGRLAWICRNHIIAATDQRKQVTLDKAMGCKLSKKKAAAANDPRKPIKEEEVVVVPPKRAEESRPMTRTILPYKYQDIIKEAVKLPMGSLEEHQHSGIFLSNNTKKYWVDKETGANCFALFARGLSIIWGGDERYWEWIDPVTETEDEGIEVASLIQVCWLEIHGKLEISYLTPQVMYEVVFTVMMRENCDGWFVPVNLSLKFPDGKVEGRKENLNEKPRGQWIDLKVCRLTTSQDMAGEVDISLFQNDSRWKSGLVVKAITIRPQKCDDLPLNHWLLRLQWLEKLKCEKRLEKSCLLPIVQVHAIPFHSFLELSLPCLASNTILALGEEKRRVKKAVGWDGN